MRPAGAGAGPGPAAGQGAQPRVCPRRPLGCQCERVRTAGLAPVGLGQEARGSSQTTPRLWCSCRGFPGLKAGQDWRPRSLLSVRSVRSASHRCPEPGCAGWTSSLLRPPPVAAETLPAQPRFLVPLPASPRWNVACVRVTGTLPGFLTYLLTCVFCYFFSFLPFPFPYFFSCPDPEFLCQLTARFFCFLLLLETNKT